MYLTSDKFSNIAQYLIDNNNGSYYIQFDDGSFATTCDTVSDWPTMEFLFGGQWLMVKPEDYFLELADNECYACILS